MICENFFRKNSTCFFVQNKKGKEQKTFNSFPPRQTEAQTGRVTHITKPPFYSLFYSQRAEWKALKRVEIIIENVIWRVAVVSAFSPFFLLPCLVERGAFVDEVTWGMSRNCMALWKKKIFLRKAVKLATLPWGSVKLHAEFKIFRLFFYFKSLLATLANVTYRWVR